MTKSVSSDLKTAFMSQNARKHSDVLAVVLCIFELHETGLVCCVSSAHQQNMCVAKHHICSAWRTSSLGQQSASKPNLATIEYINIENFSGFPK